MEFKKLQKLTDKGIVVLSDHDDKRHEERYIKLQEAIEEAQDFIEKGNYSSDIDDELSKELKLCISRFKESKIIFVIFLVILCGLLFIGVFYISYSHFYDHWYDGGHFIPPNVDRPSDDDKDHDHRHEDDEWDDDWDDDRDHHHHSSTTTTKIITTSTTTTPTVVEPDPENGFVTVIFDNSSLVDIENMIPVEDSVGLNSKPVTWKLDSALSKGSKDYVITYTIDFIDKIDNIPISQLLDITKVKYQLLVKKDGNIIYNSEIQYLKDYPEIENGIRPIITGETYNNDEILDFELRMWLDSSTGNSEQGKMYRFNINVEATYEFIE